jgi:hypothetical protein
MLRWDWDRAAPGFGIIFVILFVVAFALAGETPSLDDSSSEIASFYADDRGKLLTVIVIFSLAIVAFLFFLGSLGTRLRWAGEPRLAVTAFGAGIVVTTIFGSLVFLTAGLVYKIAESGDDGVITAISDLTWVGSVLISFPAATLVWSTAITSLRSRLLPEWFGWISAAAALAILASGTTWARDGFWAPDGAYNAYITPLLFMAWVLVLSVLLLMRVPVRTEPAARVAAEVA